MNKIDSRRNTYWKSGGINFNVSGRFWYRLIPSVIHTLVVSGIMMKVNFIIKCKYSAPFAETMNFGVNSSIMFEPKDFSERFSICANC